MLFAVLMVFGGLYLDTGTTPRSSEFALTSSRPQVGASDTSRYDAQLLPNTTTQFVHSPTAAEISGGRLRAFWYGGSSEGAADVAIYTSVFSPQSGRWSRERIVITPELAQRYLHRYVRNLGNPVVGRGPRGRLWLYFVSVSLGGWSGSAVNAMVSEDDGETWSPPHRLVASPFLNIGTLVKGAPFLFADGTIGLPAYHELLGKFAELLRLDGDGNVIAKTRLSWGRSSLQPEIVSRSASEAVAFLRYAGDPPGRMLATRTKDGGSHWSAPVRTSLPNPNSALACTRVAEGLLLLAFNDSEANRENLALAISRDFGSSWRVVHRFEGDPAAPRAELADFSYPWMLQDDAGDVHVLYAWGHKRIKHVRFNLAWLAERD